MNKSQLHRILYSGWDFQQALSALTFLLEEIDFEKKYSRIAFRKFRCYEVNAIISFCRPFEAARGKTTLSLKNIGFKPNKEEKELKNKLMFFRRKIVAHSDDEEMHFRYETHEMTGKKIVVPLSVFDELLHLNEEELHQFEDLLHKLMHYINLFTFDLAQNDPELLNFYKTPNSRKDQ